MLDQNGTIVDLNDTFVDSNATYSEHNETIAPAVSKYRPLVRTLQVELNSDGRLALKGRILPDGDTALTEVGFILSRSLFADLNTLEAVRVEGTLSGDIFTASSTVPDFGKRFYYRAYAINTEGNNLGVAKLFVMPELVLSEAWWANANEAEAGWRISPWFGAFLPYENSWVYHAELGWLYAQSDGVNGALALERGARLALDKPKQLSIPLSVKFLRMDLFPEAQGRTSLLLQLHDRFGGVSLRHNWS